MSVTESALRKLKTTTIKEDLPGGLALRISIRIHKDRERLNAVDLLNVMRNGHPQTVAVIPCIVVIETWSLRKNKSI